MGYVNSLADSHQLFSFPGMKYGGFSSTRRLLPNDPCSGFGTEFKASALRKSKKKSKVDRKTSDMEYLESKTLLEDNEQKSDGFTDDDATANRIIPSPRNSVLQACIVTSGFLLAFGLMVRQASHVASSMLGWRILDASGEVSFDFETSDVGLILGLVILISSFRYILLKTWPDFAESSEAANQQVLSSLQPLDYLVVAFLPGVSEELLFRGALLPLFGLNWKSALVVGAVFGGLHLGSGRRYSFALWATFVGFAYGMATVFSSNVLVPAASHSLNNLIGGILWRYTSNSQDKLK